ncbi:hypothetical protein AB0M39_04395 [Streptomyces sp. NPDC051907]|uniref:hypothetical protein n=1 Tax=Streptomyces sp. NPDC051907 TaxID=3155284 RepID=UPI003441B2C5
MPEKREEQHDGHGTHDGREAEWEEEVTAVRVRADAAPGETAVIRLIGMLPADWVCGQRVEEDRIWLRVHSAGGAGTDVVRERLAAALRDSSLPGWRVQDPGPPGPVSRA